MQNEKVEMTLKTTSVQHQDSERFLLLDLTSDWLIFIEVSGTSEYPQDGAWVYVVAKIFMLMCD